MVLTAFGSENDLVIECEIDKNHTDKELDNSQSKQIHDLEVTAQHKEILNWIEVFRNYFKEKDLAAISNIFSDDILIFNSGKIVHKENAVSHKSLEKSSRAKELLVSNLKHIFATNQPFDVEISQVSIYRHGINPDIYGLTFHIEIQSSWYKESGWLFMLWDFEDKELPSSYIRTWQPDEVAEADGIFNLSDFYLP